MKLHFRTSPGTLADWKAARFTLALFLFLSVMAQAAAPPAFVFTRWKTGEEVRLADFAGKIVVLDFFAYWCGPCKKASREIEHSIGKHYADQRGNPHGVPVQLLSVTIEQAKPERTDEFIKELGLAAVVSDRDGTWMEKYGFAGAPAIVVIDGTRSPQFKVVYRYEGYEGTKKMRSVIDAIKAPQPKASRTSEQDSMMATGAPVQHRLEWAVEGLVADDVRLGSSAANYIWREGRTELRAVLSHLAHEIDYEPFTAFDFLGYAAEVKQEQWAGQGGLRHAWAERWTASATAGVYEGFTDYRSMWLATYYRQQFEFVSGYEEPNPRGKNGQASVRWEYWPAAGFLEARFAYANDRIAPGWEMDALTGALHRGREQLHTYAPGLALEHVWTRRVRTLNEFSLANTSGREVRYGYRGSVNAALGERWVLRGQGGVHARGTPAAGVVRGSFAGL